MEAHKLAQIATLPDCVALNLSNPILLFSITKQNAYTKIAAPNTRAIFTRTKVKRFIKSFDQALLEKHTNAIYNGQTKK